MKALKKIALIVNPTKPKSQPLAERLCALAEKFGVKAVQMQSLKLGENDFEGFDAACVLGGDGTLLSCIKQALRADIPVFGINFGKLGFLATFKDSISDWDFKFILDGNYKVSERALLSAKAKGKSYVALNDIVVRATAPVGMYEAIMHCDGEYLADYSADGVIVSTPTGSTAYNLSAGGPLLTPQLNAYVLTPICPHALANRSIIFDASSVLDIESPTQSGDVFIDGERILTLAPGEKIRIEANSKKIKFLRAISHSHFKILQNKLGWAENPRGNRK